MKRTALSRPTVGKALDLLVELGVARETSGRQWRRVFVYDRYLALLSQGTEPL
jgi:DNA-binding GntR family transcriptional regulator